MLYSHQPQPLSGSSAIEDWFLRSDQRYPYVKCENEHYNFLKMGEFSLENKDSNKFKEEAKEVFTSAMIAIIDLLIKTDINGYLVLNGKK